MAKLTNFDLDGVIDSLIVNPDLFSVPAIDALKAAASDLKEMIISKAEAEFTSSQASILRHIQDISVGTIEKLPNGYGTSLSINGNLSRPSLNHNSAGAYDIVGLFISGWEIHKRRPWGSWHGMIVGARMSKPGMSFLSSAIDEFNSKYAGSGIYASIGD